MDEMEKEKYLSFEETEELCRLYMECHLSRLEEEELNYVLGFLPYSSPTIDEVRALMSVSLSCSMEETAHKSKERLRNRNNMAKRILTIAASIALLLSIGIPTYMHFKSESYIYCQVFAYGKEVGKEKAIAIAEEEMERIDRFFESMSDAESEQQERIESF